MKDKPTAEEEVDSPKKLITTISELYLYTRQKLLQCKDEYEHYQLLLESINIGMTMLSNNNNLNNDVEGVLNAIEEPERYNMNYLDSRQVYSCSYGTGETGKITVRPDELEIARDSMRNQRAGKIVLNLMPLDRRIFSELIKQHKIKDMEIEDKIIGDAEW